MNENIERLRADIRRLEEEIASWERDIEELKEINRTDVPRKVILATRPQLE